MFFGRSDRTRRPLASYATSLLLLLTVSVSGGASASTKSIPVGHIGGELDISGGAANYSVPVAVPPGIAGLEPILSLNYSSQSMGGLMGYGWDLGGLSTIQRCGKNLLQDGVIRKVKFDKQDNYCLDGQRLVPVSGVNGGDGTEYRTEIDSFSRIKSYGQAGQGPKRFKVWTKSGQIIEYGYTNDSRIEAVGKGNTVMTWAVNKIADTTTGGNAVDFYYTEMTGHTEYVPKYIAYGPNRSVKVRFEYEAAANQQLETVDGVKYKKTQRLKNIRTYVQNSSLVQYWKFKYFTQRGEFTRLTDMEVCAGTVCLPKTTFTWTKHKPAVHKTAATTYIDFDGKSGADQVRVDARRRVLQVNYNGTGWKDVLRNVQLDTKFVQDEWFGGSVTIAPELSLGDFNGDGLTDIYASTGNVYLSLGAKGFKYKTRFTPPTLSDYSWSRTKKGRVVVGDVNGDGYDDLISNARSLQVALATGTGTFNRWAGWGPKIVRCQYWDWCTEASDIQVFDINADGLSDVVAKDVRNAINGNPSTLFVSTGKKFEGIRDIKTFERNGQPYMPMITAIRNNTETHITYKLSSDTRVNRAPKAAYPYSEARVNFLVSEVKTDNGVGGQRATRYTYDGAKTHKKYGFLGFASISETDAVSGTKVTSYFDQGTRDPRLVGMVTRTDTRLADGTLISYATNSYAVKPLSFSNGRKTYFPHVTQSRERSYTRKGAFLSETVTNNRSFDSYGNVGLIEVVTKGGGETHKKVTLNRYDNITRNYWHLGRLRDARVIHYGVDGKNIAKHSTFAYDAKTGLLTRETVEPNTPQAVSTHYVYDQHGNKRSVIKEHPRATNAKDRTPFISVKTDYDRYGQFPVRIRNTLGHAERPVYDPRYGNVKEMTSPNGLKTRWQYDVFGNRIREDRADGTFSKTERYWAKDCPNAPKFTEYCVKSTASGSAQSEAYFDNLGRKLRTVTKAFDGRYVYTDTLYNAKGQVEKISRPYFKGDPIHWAKTSYDDLGRAVRTEEPGENGKTLVTRTLYDGFVTQSINAMNRVKYVRTNVLGKIVEVKEPESARVTYKYNATGNLLETRDAKGNITRLAYDRLGRKVRMDDPDMGVWTYEYDTFGNLSKQTDAKGQVVRMEYDRLGRMVKRVEPEGSTYWTYDKASRGIGKLYKVSGPNGYTKSFQYDHLGRVSKASTYIAGQSLSVQTQYDRYSRVHKVIRPQGFVTENVYTAEGYLKAVRGKRSDLSAQDANAVSAHFSKLLKKVVETHSKVASLRSRARIYMNSAAYWERIGKSRQNTADRLNRSAKKLRDAANALRKEADALDAKANKYKAFVDSMMAKPWIANVMRNKRQATLNYVNRNRWVRNFVQNYGERYINYYHSNNWFWKWIGTYYTVYADSLADTLKQQAAKKRSEAQQNLSQANNESRVAGYYTRSAAWYLRVAESRTKTAEAYTKAAQELSRSAANTQKAMVSLANLKDSGAYVYYWQAKSLDASGRVTEELYGNGLSNYYGYNTASGLLDEISTGLYRGDRVRHLTYEYDALQNVTQRADLVQQVEENFRYDTLDRVRFSTVKSQLAGKAFNKTTEYRYDNLGNITYKSDVGYYRYDSRRPHAVSNAGGRQYSYDNNGNMLSGAGRTLKWTSFNKPREMTRNGKTVKFTYAPDRSRYQKTNSDGSKTLYLGKLYERTAKGAEVTHKQFIYAGGKLVATHTSGINANNTAKAKQVRYMHRDNLGSIDTVTDSAANVVERMSFDPFGSRRPSDWRVKTAGISLIPVLTNRGFTGHEHIDNMDLIHMNGRVYDPLLGRFLSADPHIQAPYNTQSYNRYSYVLNNPLKYTDPSGFFFKSIFRGVRSLVKKIFRAIARVPILNTVLQAAACFYGGPMGCAAYASVSAYSTTGNLGLALRAGLTSYISATVTIPGAGVTVESVALNGLYGGIMAEAQGGKFKNGFLSSAFSAATAGVAKWGKNLQSVTGRVLVSAGLSGTASAIGGGKFANGAAGGVTAGYLAGDYDVLEYDNEYYDYAIAAINPHEWQPGCQTILERSCGGGVPTGLPIKWGGSKKSGSAGVDRTGKNFTPKTKRELDVDNAARNGGVNRCESCGVKVVPGKRSQRGVTPPGNERHRDHIIPKSKGGDGTFENGQILCRTCNLNKRDDL